MHIIKLDATESTNLYLKNLTLSSTPDDLTVVIAKEQTNGKGQMGAIWQSSSGKNLTFSVLKEIDGLSIVDQFQLNMAVSLAIFDTLKTFHVPHLKIKWPNDILSGTSKVCGILIENMLKGSQIRTSIIGIGLNVNQTDFPNPFNATSLKLLLGQTFDLEEVLQVLLENLFRYLQLLESGRIERLSEDYLEVLFRKGEVSSFQKPNGKLFNGIINGISEGGRLQVRIEGVVKEFNLKDIKLLY